MKKEPTPTSTEGVQEEFLHHCDNCDKGIKGTTYYCAECDIYVCYDCMLMGAKCPKCKTKLEKV